MLADKQLKPCGKIFIWVDFGHAAYLVLNAVEYGARRVVQFGVLIYGVADVHGKRLASWG